jgi:hypothetical protein
MKPMTAVIVNPWLGEGFKYPQCTCWACGKPATVAEIADPGGALLVRLCGTCLHEAQQAISRAILDDVKARAPRPEPYIIPSSLGELNRRRLGLVRPDSDDDGYPD